MKNFVLRSPLLTRAGLFHGFTTRGAGDCKGDADARRRLCAEAGAGRLRLLRQVHGVRVVTPEDPEERPEADGWAGSLPAGTLLGILTADCLPVILYHEATGAVALLHAGWRGATAGIVRSGLDALGARGARPGELVAALGPAIGPCCYEVGQDVADAARRHPSAVAPRGGGKYHFDLPGFVRLELESSGVAAENIDAMNLCTACRPELFFSHRRDADPGRLCAFAGGARRPGHGAATQTEER